MEPSEEVFLIIVAVVIAHFLIFYLLTRKKKSIEGELVEVAKVVPKFMFSRIKRQTRSRHRWLFRNRLMGGHIRGSPGR